MNEWFESYDALKQLYSSERFGGLLALQSGQLPKTNFFQSFKVLVKILKLHLFRFPKNFFSLDPVTEDSNTNLKKSRTPV